MDYTQQLCTIGNNNKYGIPQDYNVTQTNFCSEISQITEYSWSNMRFL